jgi:hypothetical protein
MKRRFVTPATARRKEQDGHAEQTNETGSFGRALHLLQQLLLVRCEVGALAPQRLPRVLTDRLHLLQFFQQLAGAVHSSHVRLAADVAARTKL